jgi:5-methylcytosine-specific restriction endonuclease McrA
MQWQRSCTKENGSLRKQFLQWQVPKKIREALRLADGNQCHISVFLSNFRYTGFVTLTSGVEFRLPKEIGQQLNLLASQNSLSLITFSLSLEPFLETVEDDLQNKIREARKLSASDRQLILQKSSKYPRKMEVSTTVFIRNQYVIAEVLERAKGICEQCQSEAPFLRASDNTPYLEVHHKKRLADGGEDTVKNAVALCPNCHRQSHYGQ